MQRPSQLQHTPTGGGRTRTALTPPLPRHDTLAQILALNFGADRIRCWIQLRREIVFILTCSSLGLYLKRKLF